MEKGPHTCARLPERWQRGGTAATCAGSRCDAANGSAGGSARLQMTARIPWCVTHRMSGCVMHKRVHADLPTGAACRACSSMEACPPPCGAWRKCGRAYCCYIFERGGGGGGGALAGLDSQAHRVIFAGTRGLQGGCNCGIARCNAVPCLLPFSLAWLLCVCVGPPMSVDNELRCGACSRPRGRPPPWPGLHRLGFRGACQTWDVRGTVE